MIQVRCNQQAKTAQAVAEFLESHPMVRVLHVACPLRLTCALSLSLSLGVCICVSIPI